MSCLYSLVAYWVAGSLVSVMMVWALLQFDGVSKFFTSSAPAAILLVFLFTAPVAILSYAAGKRGAEDVCKEKLDEVRPIIIQNNNL